MSSLIGDPFDAFVAEQINVRQKIHGSGMEGTSRTSEQLTYLNSKTAWVKLASGVFVDGDRIKKLGFSSGFSGKELAKNFVLQGGVNRIDSDGKSNFRGINPDGGDRNGVWDYYSGPYNVNATGQNSDLEFGLVPMPGIETVDVKFLNRGSIKRSTIKIKAYNKAQFDIIDALYLRLGYSVLLEWGNSMYVKDSTGKLITNYNTLIDNSKGWFSDKFSKSSTSLILNTIRQYKISKAGNYDGMFGKVSNFSWSFNNDGSYDIELKLISHGDIIESLKLNTVPNPLLASKLNSLREIFKSDLDEDDQETLSDEPNPQDNIISAYLFLQKVYVYQNYEEGSKDYFKQQDIYYEDSDGGEFGKKGVGIFVLPPEDGVIDVDIEEWFYYEESFLKRKEELTKEFGDAIASGEVKWGTFNSTILSGTEIAAIAATGVGGGVAAYQFVKPLLLSLEGQIKIDVTKVGSVGFEDIVYMNYIEEDDRAIHGKGFYMRLGHLLQFIETNAIPKVEPKGGAKNFPILKIDSNSWASKMLYYPNQTSLDSRVCIVNSDIDRYKIFKELISWKNAEKGYALTMNIYVNHNTIQNAINDNLDDQGNIALYPMISSICTELNKALGGINNLEPVIDEADGILKIIDSSYSVNKDPNPPYQLETFGYNNKNKTSNFIRNIDLKTEITKEYASMITIGATAGGYVKGTEATAFSKWSEGYTDRFKEKLLPATGDKDKDSDENEPAKNYFDNYFNTGIDLMLGYKYIDVDDDVTSNDAPQLQDDVIDSNIAIVTEYYRYINEQARKTNKKFASKTNGFIPFNLGLTLDGISGIKIYNKVNIDTRFLPQNYPDALQFIVKGVNHKLSNNDWETQIETQAVPESLDNKPSYDLLAGIIAKDIAAKGKAVTYSDITDTRVKETEGVGDGGEKLPGQTLTPAGGTGNTSLGISGANTPNGKLVNSALPKTQIDKILENARKNTKSAIRLRIVEIAASYVGLNEVPGANQGWYNAEYEAKFKLLQPKWVPGLDEGPWCVWFCQLCWKEAYTTGNAYVPSVDSLKYGAWYKNIWDKHLNSFNSWKSKPITIGEGKGFGRNAIGAGTGYPKTYFPNFIGTDMKKHPHWVPIKDVKAGKYIPKPGDVALYSYGHGDLVVSTQGVPFKDGSFDVIGGNTVANKGATRDERRDGGHTAYISGKSYGSVSGFAAVINPRNVNADSPKFATKSGQETDNVITNEEIEDAAEEITRQQKKYIEDLFRAADKLYSVMEGYDDNTKVVIDKLVRETTPEFRKDVRTLFDSFARLSAPAYGTTAKRSGWRLATDIPNNRYKQGRWLSNGKSYTDKQGNAPSRSPSNKYEGYTLNEWIIGDFYGSDEAKYLAYFS